LGTTNGQIVSWSDTQIVASVASVSQSGTAQVLQGGIASNSVAFTVNTPTITAISPTSGIPGAQVTISGSNLGSSQGSGSVWLGRANGTVVSWSDTQVVATVATGSTTGTAQILQNSMLSNPVAFTVNVPHITTVSPAAGSPGTTITITGTGFGTTQGSGTIQLGTTAASVSGWSNTQIVASVASGSQNGIAQVVQNSIASNSINFSVPGSGTTTSVNLNPNLFGMAVGDTRTLQALDANGNQMTGLTWASSNTSVASLSTDDPPIITALAAGQVTITAGDGSATLTVFAGALPLGTVQWSSPGDGSSVTNIVPAVPSASGVADVFAQNYDCNLQAITSDGHVAWTSNIGQLPPYTGNLDQSGNPQRCSQFVPDFQGGAIVKSEFSKFFNEELQHLQYQIQKFDGITGQAYAPVQLGNGWWVNINAPRCPLPGLQGNLSSINTYAPTVVHPDGTVFTLDMFGPYYESYFPTGPAGVDVVNPVTGQNTPVLIITTDTDNPFNSTSFEGFGNLIIAGDGYAYVPYAFYAYTLLGPYDSNFRQPPCPVIGEHDFRLLRIGTDGSATSIKLGEWPVAQATSCSGPIAGITKAYVITNADQGVLVSWQVQTGATGAGGNTVNSTTNYVTIVNGTSVVSQVTNSSVVAPELQAQDGSYYGANSLTNPGVIYHLDSSGNLQWSVPNDSPQIATADGGVIGASGASYDIAGNATGQTASQPAQSWTGNAYQMSPVKQVTSTPPNNAQTFWALSGANPSGSSTAAIQESMYVRSFVPWQWFGVELPWTTCSSNCFQGDNRSFTTSLTATARITGILKFWQPKTGSAILGSSRAFSDPSYDTSGNTKTGTPKISTSYGPNGYTFHMEFAGSNPLYPGSPDINTKFDFTPAWSSGQICYSGHLYGDAFPDAEVFEINSQNQATMLLTFATQGTPNGGPIEYLPGDNSRDMGSFSGQCAAK
jgi:hypothetical protein